MVGFETWIRELKSTLCNPSFELQNLKKKTLVMDLNVTLIVRGSYTLDCVVDCRNGNWYSIVTHPMTLTFLHKMGQHYQGITIYASSSEVYATEITRQITMRVLQGPIIKLWVLGECCV
ncbi:hypothetical protein PSTG_15735 [Puccinia striiformis f. sp. tritici PST-78]|uniref:FCP1 homology domain-containing protein n=1 Tax=Puccinia striiformis f. sp. tritici PST-78 TaxID=1165861 RepID=A0A0L0UV53_9BASI|nr:hypothetical protein PSTG_15735 [Puccinia striiformis f. sp. tritici PST-78]